MRKPILSTHALVTGYRSRHRERILGRLPDLELYRGEMVCLIGPNGSGKSTLLKTLTGVIPPLLGSIYLSEVPLLSISAGDRARSIAVVLTGRPDSGFLTVRQLVSMGRYPHRRYGTGTKKEDEAIVDRSLVLVGAEDLASVRASDLSDGEFQKVMIARALAQEPELLVLDEPAAFLDLTRRVELMHLLRTIAREEGTSILLSSHDLELVLRSSDRVWLMEQRGGMRFGAPEDLVLSGVLEEVFHGEGVSFNRELGAFVADRPVLARAVVDLSDEAEAPIKMWTGRALSRVGVASVEDGDREHADFRIRIRRAETLCTWEVEDENGVRSFTSLYDLSRALDQEKGIARLD